MNGQTLFLAWQSPEHRSWTPIGRLARAGSLFTFQYTAGVFEAIKLGFQPLVCFPDVTEVYESESLLPVFSNRVLSPARADFAQYAQYLNLPQDESDPLVILARSGGRKVTDSLEVFSCPQRDEHGRYHTHFFAHGLSHFAKATLDCVERLSAGRRLFLVHDFQNEFDPNALFLRTDEDPSETARVLVGFCPRYLSPDLRKLSSLVEVSQVCVTVERVNLPPAPLRLRLLCNITAPWPTGFDPFSGPEFRPVESKESIAA